MSKRTLLTLLILGPVLLILGFVVLAISSRPPDNINMLGVETGAVIIGAGVVLYFTGWIGTMVKQYQRTVTELVSHHTTL